MKLTSEQINDAIVTALEGGINYWCDRARIHSGYVNDVMPNEYLSDVFTRGIPIILEVDAEEYTLSSSMLNVSYSKYLSEIGRVYDPNNADAVDADCLVQLAIFGDVKYG